MEKNELVFRKKLMDKNMTPQEAAVRRPFRVETCRCCKKEFETRAIWNRHCPHCGKINWFTTRRGRA